MARRLLKLPERLGLDPGGLCRRRLLDRATLADPHGRVPQDRALDFLEELLQRSRHPALGLVPARRRLAEARPTDEVAVLLGCSERSAFHRVCARWFGSGPAKLRREVGGG